MLTEFVHRQNIYHLKRKLAAAPDDATRETIQRLLDEELERGERLGDARFDGGDHHPEY